MKPRFTTGGRLPRRLFLIGVAVAAMVGLVRVVDYAIGRGSVERSPLGARPAGPGKPIAAEAQVFRTRPGDLALSADLTRRRPAHPRTLATTRALRAFPGAPPRIPHGLTRDEFRSTGCNTCHERGGYAVRFEAYTPVTPHPEFTDCLQCHVGNDALIGIALPGSDLDARCRQCHTPGVANTPFIPLDWRALAWPRLNQAALVGSPPTIPHDLQLRGNCLACHMGEGAVEQLRTTHPERANCRQCHVPASSDTETFTRAIGIVAAQPGRAP